MPTNASRQALPHFAIPLSRLRLPLTLPPPATIRPRSPANSIAGAASPSWRPIQRVPAGLLILRETLDLKEGFRHVTAMRTDRQGRAGRPQGEPLEPQDQTAVPAQPAQRHRDVGFARPLGEAAGVGERPQDD